MFKVLVYKKTLYKPINIRFDSHNCIINGILMNHTFKLNHNFFFINHQKPSILIIHKMYIRTFFSLILKIIDGISYGFKAILKLKGKGLRLQLKTHNSQLHIYLKLGYSHKIFFKLPANCWIYIFERRRSLVLYSLNYCDLRMILLKIRMYYPVNLYKIRGFFEPTEIIKQKKGKSRLGSGSGY